MEAMLTIVVFVALVIGAFSSVDPIEVDDEL